MTLGDLLRQDGALVLLGMGAAIGFFVGRFFRDSARKRKTLSPDSARVIIGPELPFSIPVSPPARNMAVIAAITAAVNKYQQGEKYA